MMRIDTIIIHRPGQPPCRVIVVRVDGRRRARIARALAAAGYPRWQIRSLLRLSVKGLACALADAAGSASFWGSALTARIATEMREAA